MKEKQSSSLPRLIAVDIDGTFVDDTFDAEGNYVVYPEIIEAFRALLRQGDIVLFASGRPFSGIAQFAAHLPKSSQIYYSTANGAALYQEDGKKLFSSYLPYSVFMEVCEAFPGEEDWSHMVYFTDSTGGYLGKPNFAPREARLNAMPIRNLNGVLIDPSSPIEKAFLTTGKVSAYTLSVPKSLAEKTESFPSSSFFYEFVQKGVSKGNSVAILAEKLQIPKERIYTFGDSGNDISLIRDYHGTAMGNGTDEAKKVAEFVTKSAKERGVAYALREHWKLIS
jgi:Cof subfamily protein (haloacid dehalogenase superfamily)